MIYSLLVLSPPGPSHGARHAAQFARHTLARGHDLHRVFFLDAGTLCGAAATVLPQDETNPLQDWIDLADQHDVELVLCVSSALKHGMLDETEAQRYERAGATVHPAFTIAGLGQLLDATANADRLVTFGG